jgi:hypothetical protein
MSRRSCRSLGRPRVALEGLLLAGAAALALSALPLKISAEGPGLQWQTALARGGAGGGGHGSGGQGGQGAGGAGAGPGVHGRDKATDARGKHGPDRLGRDGGGHAGGGHGYHDLNELVDTVRSGKAFGLERRDERVTAARERYQEALGKAARGQRAGHDLGPDERGPIAHHFSPAESRALIERGWKGPSARNDGFRNHGERVRTMVELAKQLGYGARVGALQANFGTPYENEIAALQSELAEAQAAGNQAEVERLEAELAEAIEKAKPGVGPDDSWATADLDVNDDGVVDGRDLEALEQTDSAGAADEPPAS